MKYPDLCLRSHCALALVAMAIALTPLPGINAQVAAATPPSPVAATSPAPEIAKQSELVKKPLPAGSFPARTGNMSAWQISFTYKSDRDKLGKSATPGAEPETPAPTILSRYPIPQEPLRRMTVTRTKPYWCAVSVDSSGQTFRMWGDGDDLFLEPPQPSAPPMLASFSGRQGFIDFGPRDRQKLVDFGRTDWLEMQWVNHNTFLGVEVVDTISCYVFRKDNMTAWIREDNRMPHKLVEGDTTRSYQILPRPSAELTFPASIAKIREALKTDRKWVAKPIPTGG